METVVIGLTGAFGSGCTTAAHALRDDRKFVCLRLSDVIREEWKKGGGTGEPPRLK
jgi:dephospho-CoA kinase